jgi:hypothetical protein
MVLACGLATLALVACGSSTKRTTTAAKSPAPAVSSTPTGTAASSTPTSTSTGTGTSAGTTTGSTASAGGATSVGARAYARQVLAYAAAFKTSAQAFQGANASGTAQALAASAEVFGVAAAQFAASLGKLTPPANLANAQDKLVAVVKTFAVDLKALSKDAATGDVAALRRETNAIKGLEPRLQAAEKAVQK